MRVLVKQVWAAAILARRAVWLRSPNSGNANNVRIVNSTGALNNNNAVGGFGVAADCGNVEIKVRRFGNITA
ncbi:MAG: DUF6273 domain-containing protein [Clostridia bacterium]